MVVIHLRLGASLLLVTVGVMCRAHPHGRERTRISWSIRPSLYTAEQLTYIQLCFTF